MLETVAEGLHTYAIGHTMMGLHLGARMSVVRLRGGSLLVHSPVRLDPALRGAIEALGPVAHITLPNAYHHVYAKPWIDAFPDATVHAAASLAKKRPDLRIDRAMTNEPHPDWEGTVIPLHIDGCALDETVLVHPATRTVISVDLTENFPTHEHFGTRTYLKLSGTLGRVGWPRPLRLLYRDRRATARSLEALLEHDFERVIIAHGDVIERDGPRLVRQTFEGWVL
ncbi:MAG: DUF4336 domain-containing protein [Sandaracinaceae bacterium]|nr:DUF4336 domain-containing protein [Sandaracinaceae bacterium]